MGLKEENARQIQTMRENFRFLREQRNWSVKILSEMSGIGEKILMDMESGVDFEIIYLYGCADSIA